MMLRGFVTGGGTRTPNKREKDARLLYIWNSLHAAHIGGYKERGTYFFSRHVSRNARQGELK